MFLKTFDRVLLLLVYKAAGFLLPAPLTLAFMFHPRGRRRLAERLGAWHIKDRESGYLWFHGASVGEVQGMLPLIAICKKDFPEFKILLTAASPTGLDAAKDKVDCRRLLPFDNSVFLRSAVCDLKVKAFIFGETEIWPELFSFLSKRKVPMILVNGRFSEGSERFWSKCFFKPVMEYCLKYLSAIFAINEKYCARFKAFGGKDVFCNGNSKYDSDTSIKTPEEAFELKKDYFANVDKPVLVIGSLRPGEEDLLFPALQEYSEREDISIIVAPRHQEKMNYFSEKLNEYGLKFEKRSDLKILNQPCQEGILLLNTLGELEKTYSFADAAVIGGTMVDGIGGHNPLEAAAYAVPIALGDYCENIDNVVEDLKAAGGLYQLCNKEDVLTLLDKVKNRAGELEEAGQAAQGVWQKHRGACQRIIDKLHQLLD